MSLKSTGLPVMTAEEKKVMHRGVSEDISPIFYKVVLFAVCMAVFPYASHFLTKTYFVRPSMVEDPEAEEGSVLPSIAAIISAHVVIFGFLYSAARADRKVVAEEKRREAEAKKAK
ncbi:hypothetical protein T439DRAFT_358655 [Meredithblackwellia eburnea MCA 4105]